ncbi:MAG: copper transporter, partial [Acidimicrobiales bacterium]
PNEVPDGSSGSNSPPVTPEPELLADLRAAGFIDFDAPAVVPVGFEVLPATGARYVVVSGPGAAVPDDQLLLPMLDQMTSGESEPAVLAADAVGGEAGEEVQPTFVAAIRDDDDLRDELSTVDNLDTFAGRAAVVLALAHLAFGQVGHYGVDDGADELVPPPVEGG